MLKTHFIILLSYSLPSRYSHHIRIKSKISSMVYKERHVKLLIYVYLRPGFPQDFSTSTTKVCFFLKGFPSLLLMPEIHFLKWLLFYLDLSSIFIILFIITLKFLCLLPFLIIFITHYLKRCPMFFSLLSAFHQNHKFHENTHGYLPHYYIHQYLKCD